MKKSILIIILTVIFLMNINSMSEETKDRFEFSIAAGMNVSTGFSYNQKGYENLGAILSSLLVAYCGVSVPFNFTYFVNDYFGLGFTFVFGYLTSIPFFEYRNITFDLRMSHKIGKKNEKHRLLIEYGAICELNIGNKFSLFSNTVDFNTFVVPGAVALLGYELRYRNFSFVIAASLNFKYKNFNSIVESRFLSGEVAEIYTSHNEFFEFTVNIAEVRFNVTWPNRM